MRLIKSLFTAAFAFILLLLGIGFTLRNQVAVPLDLLVIQLPENSLALWLLLGLLVGALLAFILLSPWLLHSKARQMQLEHQLKQHKAELKKIHDAAKAEEEERLNTVPSKPVVSTIKAEDKRPEPPQLDQPKNRKDTTMDAHFQKPA